MTVGERIRQQRESVGMSQDELAKKMGYKDRSSISKIEKESDLNITLETVQKVSEVLGCSPLYLMGWSDINGNKIIEEANTIGFYAKLFSQLKDSDKEIVNNLIKSLASKE